MALRPVRFSSTTCATLFAGGGGWESGAVQARVRPLWSVEIDPEIGEVLEHNLSLAAPKHRTLITSVLDISPTRLANQAAQTTEFRPTRDRPVRTIRDNLGAARGV